MRFMKNGKKSEYIPIYSIKYHENWYLCALEVNELTEMKIKYARVMNNQWYLWKMKRIWNITLHIPVSPCIFYHIYRCFRNVISNWNQNWLFLNHDWWIRLDKRKNGTVFAVVSAITLKNRFCIIYLLILHV